MAHEASDVNREIAVGTPHLWGILFDQELDNVAVIVEGCPMESCHANMLRLNVDPGFILDEQLHDSVTIELLLLTLHDVVRADEALATGFKQWSVSILVRLVNVLSVPALVSIWLLVPPLDEPVNSLVRALSSRLCKGMLSIELSIQDLCLLFLSLTF